MLALDENWRVRPDSNCWILERKTNTVDTDGKAVWKICGYFQMLADALRAAVNKMLKSTRSIDAVLAKIDKLHKMIENLYTSEVEKNLQVLPKNAPIAEDDLEFLE